MRQLYRRLRFGEPIVVVSGLPRSGTSMLMHMLEQGGLPILSDGNRRADDDNPLGYFEYEPVKQLERPSGRVWLRRARGKAVKIVSFLLAYLPATHNYRVIFLSRDLHEVLASQRRMLVRRGELADEAANDHLRDAYERHLHGVKRMLSQRVCFHVLDVDFADVLREPHREAVRISRFLGRDLDTDRMADAVEPALYRNRRDPHT